jgi:hypothetical protein
MAIEAKLVKMRPTIEPGLKAFLDEVLVPMLVADALRDLITQNSLVVERRLMAHSPATSFSSAQGTE